MYETLNERTANDESLGVTEILNKTVEAKKVSGNIKIEGHHVIQRF